MKILILKGSPHKNGTTNAIVNEFIKGAKANKNNIIEEIDVAHASIHPCKGCDNCMMNGPCIQKDDGEMILKKILESNLVVFVTPVYYFGFSARLKTLIDRFYSKNMIITSKHLKVIYIAASWNNDSKVMKAISEHMDILSSYLEMEEVGRILAKGAGSPSMINEKYLFEAYKLGKSL